MSVLGNLARCCQCGWYFLVMMLLSLAQSDLDAVGAYGGGVRVDIVETQTVDSFLTPLKDLL